MSEHTAHYDWKLTSQTLPSEGRVVMTKIHDADGCRKQPLKRQRNLWFFPDGSMYVYYRPTHWAEMPAKAEGREL